MPGGQRNPISVDDLMTSAAALMVLRAVQYFNCL